MADTLLEYLKNKLETTKRLKLTKRAYTAVLGDKSNTQVKTMLNDLKLRFGYYDVRDPKPNRSRDFYEGQRSVVLHILTMSTRIPDEDVDDIEEMMKLLNNQ